MFIVKIRKSKKTKYIKVGSKDKAIELANGLRWKGYICIILTDSRTGGTR